MTDTPADPRSQRRQAVSDLKRQMILDAAERIFQQEGWTEPTCGPSPKKPATR
jgi:AcrR family transcriptional regulator